MATRSKPIEYRIEKEKKGRFYVTGSDGVDVTELLTKEEALRELEAWQAAEDCYQMVMRELKALFRSAERFWKPEHQGVWSPKETITNAALSGEFGDWCKKVWKQGRAA